VQVIPVIDLQGGTVVRARFGQRHLYRPLETPLAASSDPVAVVRGFLAVHPFVQLYVADLDAIADRGSNQSEMRRLRHEFPLVQLWVDNGARDQASVRSVTDQDLGCVVLGSESQTDTSLLRKLCNQSNVILSLDFRSERFLGPQAILTHPEIWPKRVIVMTLARVGSASGPDKDRIATILATKDTCCVYAAGGIRNSVDLLLLKRMGVAGALVASALHSGDLTSVDLATI
jgi:phosphoribosylformimino-5-aminoimidazole carboxamide ribotide isomerase